MEEHIGESANRRVGVSACRHVRRGRVALPRDRRCTSEVRGKGQVKYLLSRPATFGVAIEAENLLCPTPAAAEADRQIL